LHAKPKATQRFREIYQRNGDHQMATWKSPVNLRIQRISIAEIQSKRA
jgi:hypothetical protein